MLLRIELRVGDETRGVVEDADQVDLAPRAVGRGQRRPDQHVGLPAVAGQVEREGAVVAVPRDPTLIEALSAQEAVERRERGRADHPARPQFGDQPRAVELDMTARERDDPLREFGVDAARRAAILARFGHQPVEPLAAIAVEPLLERARRDPQRPALRVRVDLFRALCEGATQGTPRARETQQRTQHLVTPQRDLQTRSIGHATSIPGGVAMSEHPGEPALPKPCGAIDFGAPSDARPTRSRSNPVTAQAKPIPNRV